MSEIKRIAVLTSGGDSPGMNAAVRAVVRAGLAYDLRVYGIKNGYQGLIDGDITEMTTMSVSDTIQRGGTILGTARCEEFKTEAGQKKGIEQLKLHDIDGLVAVGGDGTFRGAAKLSEAGVKTIGLPGTIDNDIPGTEFCIGFDTAVNTVCTSIDMLRDTASAHHRTIIVEVMGRACGWIALVGGIVGGADAILIPEVPFDYGKLVETVKKGYALGKSHTLIVVAEGAAKGYTVGEEIKKVMGEEHEVRVSVLGYIQRGGSPKAFDRLLASRFGRLAVKGLMEGKTAMMTGWVEGQEVLVPFEGVVGKKNTIDPSLYELANILATSS